MLRFNGIYDFGPDMTTYEYKVVPAPDRGRKARGVKGADGRFAHALEDALNELAAEGWEYQRAETLPSEERQGLSGKATVFRNVLVFRRARDADLADFEPRLLDPPQDTPPQELPKDIPVLDAARILAEEKTPETAAQPDTPEPSSPPAPDAAAPGDATRPEGPAKD